MNKIKTKCIDYNKCESKKCSSCQRNAKIRICACCKTVYISKECPFCGFGASYGAYFVLENWIKVLWRLATRKHIPKENIAFMK